MNNRSERILRKGAKRKGLESLLIFDAFFAPLRELSFFSN
jgi:hypothetical protein